MFDVVEMPIIVILSPLIKHLRVTLSYKVIINELMLVHLRLRANSNLCIFFRIVSVGLKMRCFVNLFLGFKVFRYFHEQGFLFLDLFIAHLINDLLLLHKSLFFPHSLLNLLLFFHLSLVETIKALLINEVTVFQKPLNLLFLTHLFAKNNLVFFLSKLLD